MRDPARIPIILERLRKVWEAHPDLRLGQLVVSGASARRSDVFYVEDEALLGAIETLAKPTRPDLPSVRPGEKCKAESTLPPRSWRKVCICRTKDLANEGDNRRSVCSTPQCTCPCHPENR